VSRYQKGKTNLDCTEARDSEWQWNPLGHMQVCTSLQTDNHASTPPLSFFTGRMPFLLPNQRRQSTEGNNCLFQDNLQKGKTCLNLNEASYDDVLGWQWHQLDHVQTSCTSLQTGNPTSTSSLSWGRMRPY